MKKLSIFALIAAMGITAGSVLTTQTVSAAGDCENGNVKGYVIRNGQISSIDNLGETLEEVCEKLLGASWKDCPDINLPDVNRPGTGTPGTGEQKPGTDAEQPDTDKPDTDKPDTEQNSYAEQVVELVNAEREKAGLQALTLDKQIASAALVRAKEIETSFSHTRPDGRSFSSVLTDNGISFRGSGENIAWGQKTPREVVTAWMNSEGHRANILNSQYTKIGVGYYQNSAGRDFWAQLFTY